MTNHTHEALIIAEALQRYLPPADVRNAWEIGSRDGRDALQILEVFPNCVVHAFEPNPDTWPLVQEAESLARGRLIAHNLALSDVDGPLVFYKIDRERTVTNWADGNPGASSLFQSTGAYDDIEKYVQIPAEVRGATAASLISSGEAPIPDLIWMDAQGAEKLILRGFGGFLSSVRAIYVELSLREMYAGQALATQVVDLLQPDFYWHSVVHQGDWQFDALFIARSFRDPSLALRDLGLRVSLRSRLKAGIAYPATVKNVAERARAATRSRLPRLALKNRAARAIRPAGSSMIGRGVAKASLMLYQHRARPLSSEARMFVEAAQPKDPLAPRTKLPPIDILIPCHTRDLDTLGLSIAGAMASTRNPVHEILLVAPESVLPAIRSRFPDVALSSDEELLDDSLLAYVSDAVPVGRRGWVIQQLVKIAATMQSDRDACLIVDADTVLLQPRTWLADPGVQLLSVSHEFHTPYVLHAERMWGKPQVDSAVSFVTHHQLMQKSILMEMFGSGSSGLRQWLEIADWNEPSAISEYHCYGAWMSSQHPERAKWAQWRNKSMRRDLLATATGNEAEQIACLRHSNPDTYSISLHSYI
jgi:FkbM family methyltransferase